MGNFLACCLLLCSRIELRDCARALPVVQPHILRLAVAGELLSVCGVGISMFSISIFEQPAVVNAAEGGIQQLLNLLFACIACRLGFGRKVSASLTQTQRMHRLYISRAMSCARTKPKPWRVR